MNAQIFSGSRSGSIHSSTLEKVKIIRQNRQLEPFCEWLHLRDDYDGDYPDYGEFQMDPDEREDGLENDEGVENDGQEDGEEET